VASAGGAEGAGLGLSADEVLTTTRAVRRRLDLGRPVERAVLEDCLRIALQAPTGSNAQGWHFVVVTDEARRRALADIYRRAWAIYETLPFAAGNLEVDGEDRRAVQQRVMGSARYLAEVMHEVPVLVVPCIEGRVDGQPLFVSASVLASVVPAAWSFMLAARERGLGTSWTSLHLLFEQEAAEVLGVPFEEVSQVALIPVAHTLGTGFRPGPREALEGIVHWDSWA
jgi:nitroreductase